MFAFPDAMDADFSDCQQALRFFHELWENSIDPFWLCECVEGDFRFLALNPAEQKIDPRFQSGVMLSEIIGRGAQADELVSGYLRCCATGAPVQFEQRPIIDGEERLFQTLLVPILDGNGVVTHLWGTARDLTIFLKSQRALEDLNRILEQRVQERTVSLHQANAELQTANRHLAELAARDMLTGLASRRHLFERGEEEIVRARRYGHTLSLLMVDLDHFKSINDRFGHATGDEVLRQIGKRLQGGLRQNDVAGRIGGEEFVLLLPETCFSEAWHLAERLRLQIVDLLIRANDTSLHVTCSIGVASLRPADQTLDSILERSDAACYQAKSAGRNQVQPETT